jgi:hypothetical protein
MINSHDRKPATGYIETEMVTLWSLLVDWLRLKRVTRELLYELNS